MSVPRKQDRRSFCCAPDLIVPLALKVDPVQVSFLISSCNPGTHDDELELVGAGRQAALQQEAVLELRVWRHVQLLAPPHIQARHLR